MVIWYMYVHVVINQITRYICIWQFWLLPYHDYVCRWIIKCEIAGSKLWFEVWVILHTKKKLAPPLYSWINLTNTQVYIITYRLITDINSKIKAIIEGIKWICSLIKNIPYTVFVPLEARRLIEARPHFLTAMRPWQNHWNCFTLQSWH